jgi:hypothetical protein
VISASIDEIVLDASALTEELVIVISASTDELKLVTVISGSAEDEVDSDPRDELVLVASTSTDEVLSASDMVLVVSL